MTTTTYVGVWPFTAIDSCPKCGDIAVHWLDEPRIPTQDECDRYGQQKRDWATEPSGIVTNWSGQVVKTVGRNPFPVKPVDESEATVVRVCRACGQRWGCA